MQSQSFSGVGAQHQNSNAEQAIQTIMYMAHTFLVYSSLHRTDMGADNISLWPYMWFETVQVQPMSFCWALCYVHCLCQQSNILESKRGQY